MICKGCGCSDGCACTGGCSWVVKGWCSNCVVSVKDIKNFSECHMGDPDIKSIEVVIEYKNKEKRRVLVIV